MHDDEYAGRRCLVWVVFGYVFGVFCCLEFSFVYKTSFGQLLLYSLILTALFGVRILTAAFAAGKRFRKGAFFRDYILAWFVLLGFVLGILRTAAFDNFYCRDLRETAGVMNEYTGVLIDEPKTSASGGKTELIVYVTGYNTSEGEKKLSGSIKLYTDPGQCSALEAGSAVSFKTILKEPKDKSFNGGYSLRSALYGSGMVFSAFADSVEVLPDAEPPGGLVYKLRYAGFMLRRDILERIDALFGEQNAESALLKGLLTGNRDDFADEQYNDFTLSGFVHITAVSGMHIMFLYSVIMFIARKLRLPRVIGNLMPIPFMILFMAAAAFTPSISRAVIMTCLMIAATLLKRESDSLTALAAAAAVILSVNPYALTSYGFILSFSSVAGIVLFSPLIYQCKNRINPLMKGGVKKPSILFGGIDGFAQSVSVSVGAQIGIGYFSARFFRFFSWGSMIGNAFVIPLASAGFTGGMIVLAVSFIFPGAAAFLARYPLRAVLWLINRLAGFFSLPVFGINIPSLPGSAFVLYAAAGYALYLFISKPNKE